MESLLKDVEKKVNSLIELQNDPVVLINGVKSIAMSYIKTNNITKNQALEAAARLIAAIHIVESKKEG